MNWRIVAEWMSIICAAVGVLVYFYTGNRLIAFVGIGFIFLFRLMEACHEREVRARELETSDNRQEGRDTMR